MSQIVWMSLTWIVQAGFYLALVGDTSALEIAAAMVCSLLGTALAWSVSYAANRHFILRPPTRSLLRPLSALLPDFLAVARELTAVVFGGASHHHGGWVSQRFDFGGASPYDAGRRALTLIGVSLAPCCFVVRGDESSGVVLLHGFPPKPVSLDLQWLA